jgi:hypothetical protein
VPSDADPPSRPTLADIARAVPDRTLQNLLSLLSGKLELLTQLPVFEYRAADEGFTRTSEAFHALADSERQSFEELLASLRIHLDETAERRTVRCNVT